MAILIQKADGALWMVDVRNPDITLKLWPLWPIRSAVCHKCGASAALINNYRVRPCTGRPYQKQKRYQL
jgi:hypothetical protein